MWCSSTISEEDDKCSTEGSGKSAVVGMMSPRSHSLHMDFEEPAGERTGAHVHPSSGCVVFGESEESEENAVKILEGAAQDEKRCS